MRFFIALILTLSLVSCSDNKDLTPSEVQVQDSERFLEVQQKIQTALQDLNRKVAFSGYASRDGFRLQSALEVAQGGMRSLMSGQDVESALIRLNTAIVTYDEMLILEHDQPRLDEIFNDLRALYVELAAKFPENTFAKTGVWNLYNYNFGSGIEPEFSTFAGGRNAKPWGFNYLIDKPKAQVGGDREANAWLVSRAFDLSNVEEPSFRIYTSTLIDSKDQTLNRKKASVENFQFYIILNPRLFSDFSDFTDEDLKTKKWIVRVPFEAHELPSGERFQTKWTPPKSIEKVLKDKGVHYKDQPLAIAFRFHPPKAPERQYHSWSILDFEINGKGRIPEDSVKYKYKFQGEDFIPKGFHVVSKSSEGKMWRSGNFKGKGFLSIERGGKSDSWLLSPKYYISGQTLNPVLDVMSVFNKESFTEEAFSKMKILVSENFKGGDPEAATWEDLDYVSLTNEEGLGLLDKKNLRNWNFSALRNLSLSNYVGKEIVLAFRYQSEKEDQHSWQIEALAIRASQGQVASLNYDMTCLVSDPFEKDIVYTFDLEKFTAKDTKNSKISGDALTWKTKEEKAGPCTPKAFFEITGHKRGRPASLGVSRKTLPVVDLSGVEKASFRILQSVLFYYNTETLFVEVSKDNKNWESLELPKGFFVRDSVDTYTDWVPLPEAYTKDKVYIGLKYRSFQNAKSKKNETPNWIIKRLEVKKD